MSEELPEGWTKTSFGDLGVLQNGPFGSLLHRADYQVGGVPLINPANIVQGRLVPDANITVGSKVLERLSSYVMREDDVVVGRRGEMGRAAVVSGERSQWFCGTGCAFLRPSAATSGRFLAHWFGSPEVRARLENDAVGATMSNLSTRILGQLDVALPPLPEQHRIVEKVEALLEQVNRAKERLDRVPLILKRFRQAVLAAACSGELTREWRSDDGGRDPPKGWRACELQKLAENTPSAICAGPFGTIFKAHDFRDNGIPIIFLRHVAPGEYRTAKPGFMDKAKWEELFRPYSVWGGELLVAKLGDPPGCCAIYPKGIGPAMVTPDVIKMTVDENLAVPEFLMHYLNSEPARQRAFGVAYGATRPRMNLDIFRRLEVPVPPLTEQKEIVARVDRLFRLADTIERRVQAATARANKLPQAILSKAFSGELVPTEAELARLEDRTYETAEELLKRVTALGSDAPSARKGRGRRTG